MDRNDTSHRARIGGAVACVTVLAGLAASVALMAGGRPAAGASVQARVCDPASAPLAL